MFNKILNLFHHSSYTINNTNTNNDKDNSNAIDTSNRINYPRKTAPPRLKQSINFKDKINYLTCINCGNFIEESIIEAHSYKCTSITKEILGTDNNEVKASNFKIGKLKEHLTELIKTNKNYYVNVIIIYIEELLSNTDSPPADNKAKIRKMIKNINSLTKTYKGSFDIQIYLERFKVLLNNRLTIYKGNSRIIDPRGSVSKISSKSYDNTEHVSCINLINESIATISVNDMTHMSGSDQNEDTEASKKDQLSNKSINHMNTKEMYKEFSQKVLKLKFEKFNNNSFIKKIQCKLLFVECLKQQIPHSDWSDFIYKEMSYNCLTYVKKTRKIAIKKMDTIHEEEF